MSKWLLLKKYSIPTIGSIAAIALVFLTFASSSWLLDQMSKVNSNLDREAPVSRLQVLWDNIFNFSSPLPYFGFAALLALAERFEAIRNRYLYGQLRVIQQEIRETKQQHGTTKRAYYDTLRAALKYRLTSPETGFNKSCRITIYRLQSNSDAFLKRILRHSPNYNYCNEGRISVPIDEGIVGVAWGNHGKDEFFCDAQPESEEFSKKMREHLHAGGCREPSDPLSMPARHYIAIKIDDHDGGPRVAIVVYESEVCGVLKIDVIKDLLRDEVLDVSRFVKHLGVLDSEFNPDPREGENG